MRRWAALVGAALAVTLLASVDGGGADAAVAPPQWTGWASGPESSARKLATLAPVTDAPTVSAVVDLTDKRQKWIGTGGGMTDSAVDLLSGNTAAIRLLYDPRSTTGARLNWARLPLSATDFSSTYWAFGYEYRHKTLTDTPQVRKALSVLWTAKQYRRDLNLVATPWTAPAFMKDNQSLIGGGFDSVNWETRYGDMLVAQVDYLRKRGMPLRAITLQNEPGYAASDYPTMTMTDAQMISLAQRIVPRLRQRSTQLWAVDHNWDDRARVDAVLAGAPGLFSAAAFHCYGGTTLQMSGLSVPAVVTECTGSQADDPVGTFAYDAQVLVHNAVEAGSTGLMFWNLALDANGGPKAAGGCAACRGVLQIDPVTKAVTPQAEFWTLAQLGRAAEAGAQVLGVTSTGSFPLVAFRNPDNTVGVFGQNPSDDVQTLSLSTDGGVTDRRFTVQPHELFTFRGRP